MQITLKAARVNAQKKQAEVARAMNIDKSTLSAWENGKTYPNAVQFKKLCKIYNINPDYIFLELKSI